MRIQHTIFLFVIFHAMIAAVAATLQVTEVVRQTDGLKIGWTAESGNAYQVQSSTTVTGPWRLRTTLEPAAGPTSWVDGESSFGVQQFYRLSVSPKTVSEAPRLTLLTGDSIPATVAFLGEQSGTMAANGVFLASQLGAGGLQLVTTGTLTQQGLIWTYSANPADRLIVQFIAGTNVTFYVTRMQGDFSVDAATFLRRNHNFDYRVVVPGTGDLSFTSDVGTANPSYQATAQGSLVFSNVTYSVNLSLAGLYRFETDSTGTSLLTDYLVTGTASSPDYRLVANYRRRFELVSARTTSGGATRFEDATTDQDWNNNVVTIGADTYQWAEASKQKSFRNGKPSQIDTYWKASGGILRNGQPYGIYDMRPDPLLVYLRFYLILPDQAIELESWYALP